MSEAGKDVASGARVHRLSEAIRDIKNATADRDDVVVELREASRMRLELLAQELEPVFAEVPKDDPHFDFAISSGTQPRLWIDAVAHVTMGHDRRTYRFLRDTRLGRVVLAESAATGPVAEQVTRYVAERMIERERAIEGDVEALPRGEAAIAAPEVEITVRRNGWRSLLVGLALVLAGAALGALATLLLLSHRLQDLGINL